MQPHFPHETYSTLPYTHTNTLARTHALPPPVRRTHSPRPAKPLPVSRRRIVSQSRPSSLLSPQGSAQLFSTFPGGGGGRLERPTPAATTVLLAARQNPITPHLGFINGTRAEQRTKEKIIIKWKEKKISKACYAVNKCRPFQKVRLKWELILLCFSRAKTKNESCVNMSGCV